MASPKEAQQTQVKW